MELTLEATQARARRLSTVKTYGHFIDGEFVRSASNETIALENPATREVLAHIQAGNAADVDRAVAAAAAAFPSWSRTTPAERQEVLLMIAQKIRERQLDYAIMESLNNGKPIMEAMHVDMAMSIEFYEFFAGAAHGVHGEILDFADRTVLIHREAIGVVAAIIPWNLPMFMATGKLAPALAAGCTVVLKPAEAVCLSLLEFMDDIKDIVPPGVINVVTGYGPEVGEPLVKHPLVRKVAFTGSRPTASKIIGYAATNIIPQTMELGGKSANIVCEDADIEAAAQSAVATTTYNKGEVCFAGTRVFVHARVEDAFLDAFQRQLQAVRQGDPLDPSTQLGAMASKAQFDKVSRYLELGRNEGARAFFGGKAASIRGFETGYFIEPTIFTGVRNDMRIAQEEIFGPVTSVIRWDDEDEMLRQVNDVEYGLAGGIWTENLRRAHRLARSMETGLIWINRYYNLKAGIPVGGYKQSGFGREGALATLEHYTHTKSVVINLD